MLEDLKSSPGHLRENRAQNSVAAHLNWRAVVDLFLKARERVPRCRMCIAHGSGTGSDCAFAPVIDKGNHAHDEEYSGRATGSACHHDNVGAVGGCA